MPVLLRAASVDDLPPGRRRKVRLRRQRFVLSNDGGTIRAREVPGLFSRSGGKEYRVEVRGPYVYVALDADPESAPATLQRMSPHPHEQ